MSVLRIRHRTSYRYRRPVQLGPHRLMLRPRESREVRLLESTLDIAPAAGVSWADDVFGSAVATATFAGPADTLVIEGSAVVELRAPPWPVFDVAAGAIRYPFSYSADDSIDLAPFLQMHYADPGGALSGWARGFVRGSETDTLALLKDLAAGVTARIAYQGREEEGTQSPQQTLARGWGSCRDFAVLFAEAARSLGFAARIISGYLHNPDHAAVSSVAGSTHAWAEVYLSGAGWIAFDPTNRAVGGFNLIPVAVGRSIAQVMPVTGTFRGTTDDYLGMTVEVHIMP